MAEQNQDAERKIEVDEQTAFNMSILEFDKLIAESEAKTADLKKQKAVFIYDTSVNSVVAQHDAKNQQSEDLAPLNNPPEKESSLKKPENEDSALDKKAKEEPPKSDTSK